MKNYTPPIDLVIRRIRESFVGAEEVYTSGSCGRFAVILKTIYPEGVIYWDYGHVIFYYQGKYYDITGQYKGDLEKYNPIFMYGGEKIYRQLFEHRHGEDINHENDVERTFIR